MKTIILICFGLFGVVVEISVSFQNLNIRLHSFGPNVMAGMILYPMEQAKSVMKFYREYARTAPDELMAYSGFIVTPDGLPVTLLLPAWLGDLEEADKHLAPIRAFGTPIAGYDSRNALYCVAINS